MGSLYIGCDLISCGEGTCKSSDNSSLGFECDCNPGWKKITIGSLSFPSCVVPNCTVDFECGSKTSTPPPPPPTSILPSLNFSNPCDLTWCGDGTCIANGTGHICSCHEGSSNLMNRTSFACFKQCSLGADCASLGINLPTPSSSPPVSAQNGATGKPNWWMTLLTLTISLVAAIFIYSGQ